MLQHPKLLSNHILLYFRVHALNLIQAWLNLVFLYYFNWSAPWSDPIQVLLTPIMLPSKFLFSERHKWFYYFNTWFASGALVGKTILFCTAPILTMRDLRSCSSWTLNLYPTSSKSFSSANFSALEGNSNLLEKKQKTFSPHQIHIKKPVMLVHSATTWTKSKGLFFWDDLDEDQQTRISWTTVHQRNW